MAIEEPEIEQGIKRRPSNRDQLLSKVIKDTSKGIIRLFKKIFLDCAGSVASRTKSKRQKIRDHAGRRVSQIMPQSDQIVAVHGLQNGSQPHSELPEHVSILKVSTTPIVAIGIQVGDPTSNTTALYSTSTDHFSAQLPAPLLREHRESQTDLDYEPSQPLMETRLEGSEIQETSSGNGSIMSPLEYILEPLSVQVEQGNAVSEASIRRSLEEETSNKASNKSRSNHGSIMYTVPGAWPKSPQGSAG